MTAFEYKKQNSEVLSPLTESVKGSLKAELSELKYELGKKFRIEPGADAVAFAKAFNLICSDKPIRQSQNTWGMFKKRDIGMDKLILANKVDSNEKAPKATVNGVRALLLNRSAEKAMEDCPNILTIASCVTAWLDFQAELN